MINKLYETVVLLQYFKTKKLCLDFAKLMNCTQENKHEGREERIFNLQGGQVHPSLHPSHLSQGAQVVRERCPQMGFLGALAVLGGQEVLEGPDKTKI